MSFLPRTGTPRVCVREGILMTEVEQRYGNSMMVITRMFKNSGVWNHSWEQEFLIDKMEISTEIVARFKTDKGRVSVDEGGRGDSDVEYKRGSPGGRYEKIL